MTRKRITFKALKSKLKRGWAKVGTLQIIDMPRNYFTVVFLQKNIVGMLSLRDHGCLLIIISWFKGGGHFFH